MPLQTDIFKLFWTRTVWQTYSRRCVKIVDNFWRNSLAYENL